jgi:hypothetical protein
MSSFAFDRHYPGGPLGLDRSRDGLFQPFPRTQRLRPSLFRCKVGVHIGLFEACSTFTGDYWGRAKNQRRFRAFGERHQRRLSPCLDPPTPRKNCLLICLVPRERVAIPNLLPRFDRGRCLEEAGQRLWLAEMSHLSDSPFTFLARLACARRRGRYAGLSCFRTAFRTRGVGPLADQQARGTEVA